MRKFLSVLLVIMLVVSLVACANNNTPDDTNEPSSTNSEEQASTNNETPTSSSSETKENVKTAQIPGREIYVDYSSSMRKKDQAYTVLMYENNDALVGLSFKNDGGFNGSLDDVVNLFKSDFINDAATSSSGDLYGSEISITSSQKTTMANRESIKFSGTVRNKDTWDCHVYGYAFIIDNIPCAVIGLVSAQAQDASMISEIDAHVEEIASTIRTTK